MGSFHGLADVHSAHEPGQFVWRPSTSDFSTVTRFMGIDAM
jgi:hypothetical protein